LVKYVVAHPEDTFYRSGSTHRYFRIFLKNSLARKGVGS
jgi:hypothetical protein